MRDDRISKAKLNCKHYSTQIKYDAARLKKGGNHIKEDEVIKAECKEIEEQLDQKQQKIKSIEQEIQSKLSEMQRHRQSLHKTHDNHSNIIVECSNVQTQSTLIDNSLRIHQTQLIKMAQTHDKLRDRVQRIANNLQIKKKNLEETYNMLKNEMQNFQSECLSRIDKLYSNMK